MLDVQYSMARDFTAEQSAAVEMAVMTPLIPGQAIHVRAFTQLWNVDIVA